MLSPFNALAISCSPTAADSTDWKRLSAFSASSWLIPNACITPTAAEIVPTAVCIVPIKICIPVPSLIDALTSACCLRSSFALSESSSYSLLVILPCCTSLANSIRMLYNCVRSVPLLSSTFLVGFSISFMAVFKDLYALSFCSTSDFNSRNCFPMPTYDSNELSELAAVSMSVSLYFFSLSLSSLYAAEPSAP